MNFIEAKTKLAKIANGRYHSVRYEISEHADKSIVQECGLYINGIGWTASTSWAGAFELLEAPEVSIEPIEELAKEVLAIADDRQIHFESDESPKSVTNQDTSNQW